MQQFQVPNAKRGPFKYEDGKFFMDSLLALTAYESDSYVVKKVDRSIVKNPLGCSFVHWGQNHFEARAKAILKRAFIHETAPSQRKIFLLPGHSIHRSMLATGLLLPSPPTEPRSGSPPPWPSRSRSKRDCETSWRPWCRLDVWLTYSYAREMQIELMIDETIRNIQYLLYL